MDSVDVVSKRCGYITRDGSLCPRQTAPDAPSCAVHLFAGHTKSTPAPVDVCLPQVSPATTNNASPRCKATNKSGKQCGQIPPKGSDFCYFHDNKIRPEKTDGLSLRNVDHIRSILEKNLQEIIQSEHNPLQKAEPIARLCAVAAMLLRHQEDPEELRDKADALSDEPDDDIDGDESQNNGPDAGTSEPRNKETADE